MNTDALSGDLLKDMYVQPHWDVFLAELARAAFPEDWSSPNHPGEDYLVLSSVVRHNYRRAVFQDRVAFGTERTGNPSVVFASGLFTAGLELLYCIGGPFEGRQQWEISRVESAPRAARWLGSTPVPAPASFWRDPCELVFDPHADFYVDLEDLATREEVVERYPAALRENNQLRLVALGGAVDRARKLAALNPRVVAPAFSFDRGSGDGNISLLLPLNLLSTDEPDMALVVKEIEPGGDRIAYRAASVIDMGQAISQARAVAPLDPVWPRRSPLLGR